MFVYDDLGGLGSFHGQHVDANCRTVNLMFFFKLRYFGLVNCRTQSVFCF